MFTDIDKLVIGDIFYITVGNRKLAYEVDNIQTVLPSEVNALKIQEGKDIATLVTCTPYGINTHRLLVTGHRVDLTEDAPKENYTDPMRDVIKPALIVSGIVGIMTIACIITITLIWKGQRK